LDTKENSSGESGAQRGEEEEGVKENSKEKRENNMITPL
jgi:hypothetical protein